ncbi:hypothetical protein [Nocardia sp. NPDC049707]|uniref:hypothetical protein n=1 Tax=Nocardia sp. NPDC049707 TaxID=3154735 RepID=UPI0034425DC5
MRIGAPRFIEIIGLGYGPPSILLLFNRLVGRIGTRASYMIGRLATSVNYDTVDR